MASGKKIRFKTSVKVIFGILILFITIAFIEASHRNKPLGKLHIQIQNQENNYFLDSLEIKRLLQAPEQEGKKSLTFRDLSIKTIETRIRANLFVEECEISRNLVGDLFIDVQLARPSARFIRESKPDFYVDTLGKIMPVSDKYTARVMLITREENGRLPDFEKKDKNLLKLLKYIHRDSFLRAQIAQIHIDKEGELSFYTQLGGQKIEFGYLRNLESKLKRVKIFYKEILPLKGWKAYDKVSVKYRNQIICE